MNLKCYIIDDRQASIRLLERYIRQTPGLELLGSDQDAERALDGITSGAIKPDITFLDIEMPEMSGIEIAGLIKDKTTIIFITGHRDYAADVYSDGADYILKPFAYERFLESIHLAKDRMRIPHNKDLFHFFPAINRSANIKIWLADIQYVKAIAKGTLVVTKEKRQLTNMALKEVLAVLPDTSFIQVHKSYLINIDHIGIIENDFIEMENGEQVPVGRVYKEKLQEKLSS